MRGSMTVEAAFVFPFCMAAIGAVCWMGVFCYNIAALRLTGAECIAHMTEFRNMAEDDFDRELLRYTEEKAAERTLACPELRVNLKTTQGKIFLEFSAVQSMIFEHFLQTEVSYTKIHPERAVRGAVFRMRE